MSDTAIAEKIAYLVKEQGGRAFYVGGFVRDRLLGREFKDVDIEVHGIEPERLIDILSEVGEPLEYGSSFGIFALKNEDIEIAMPRRERATGKGHRAFAIEVDPFAGTLEAARRRDFTVNALMEDVLTGEIIDHFGGREDLRAGMLRHIDAGTFVEDPLRVLRAARFAAGLEFSVADETTELCKTIDVSTLSRERVEEEMKKALLKAERPSVFFESLRAMNQLAVWFPELEQTIGIEQDPIYHPEGDVWTHTMEVVDRAAAFRDRASSPYAFMLLALIHDLGKITATEVVKGRIHAYGHEKQGLPIAKAFLTRLTGEKDVISYVLNMLPLHMKPNVVSYSEPKVKSTNRMFDEAVSPADLIYFSMADRPVFSGKDEFSGNSDFLWERLKIYEEMMAVPHVTGRDLIDAGLEPGEYFGEVLEYAHKLRLAGVDRESALKQTLAYARTHHSE